MNRSTALIASMSMNVFLSGLTVWLLRPTARPGVPEDGIPPATTVAATAVEACDSNSLTFHWSQIESTNYFTYISNLRAIGCPPQTVRDLIVADVDGLYAPRRQQLRDQQVRTGQNLQLHFRQLQQEESTLISRLLDTRDGIQTGELLSAENSDNQLSLPQAALPLAFVDADTNFVQLNDRQQSLVEQARRSFTQELGLSPDVASPEYAQKWRQAQPEYDEMMEVVLGREAYVEMQRQAGGRRPAR
jgi:hypothetical protein